MTKENLQDALGLIDDDMIAAMDELRQKHEQDQIAVPSSETNQAMTASDSSAEASFSSFRKKILRREFIKWGSLAASLCLLIGVTFWSGMGASSSDMAAENQEHYYSDQKEQMEAVIENDSKATSPDDNAGSPQPETWVQAETIRPETSPETSTETTPAAGTLTPPSLEVLCGSTSIIATSGNYDWSHDNGDGTTSHTIACGMHPLECQDTLVRIHTTQDTAQLQFLSAPSTPMEISVQCWSETHWGDMSAESEPVTVTDGQIQLKPGGYIYEVTAKWARGTVHYAFFVYYEEGGHMPPFSLQFSWDMLY